MPGESGRGVGAKVDVEGDDRRIVMLWQWRADVARFLRRRGASPQQVEDVMSDVYTVVWRRLDDLPACPDAAVGWMCGVARRALRDHRRAEARRLRLLTACGENAGSFEAPAMEHERILAAESLLRLSPAERAAVVVTATSGGGGRRPLAVSGVRRSCSQNGCRGRDSDSAT